MKTIIYTIILAFFGSQLSFAQVGIGTITPDPNAVLDIVSTTQGVLIPRMTKAQRELIGGGTPAAGLMVYQTDETAGFYFYDGIAWTSLNTITPSGLESVDEGNGIGLVRIGRNPDNYGNVGNQAVDLSDSSFTSTTRGATGTNSTAMGYNTRASGDNSTAMGYNAIASGEFSTAMGSLTTASGNWSTAMGDFTFAFGYASTAMGSLTFASGDWSTAMGDTTTASGEFSTAMGNLTTASGNWSTAMGDTTVALGASSTAMGYATKSESRSNLAIGEHNVGGGDPIFFVQTDPLFEIGNGFSDTDRSNALTVLKNGTITAPSFDISEITDAKALITKEYFDANKFSANYDDLFNQPILFDGDYNDLYNVPAPFSADYNDLINTPLTQLGYYC